MMTTVEGAGRRSKVLVVGASGYMGQRVVRACLDLGHQTFVLVRPRVAACSIHKAQILMYLKRAGATLVQASIDDLTALVDAMKQIDVVISCMAEDQLLTQLHLIKAAKQAGTVKRFLPSEFGMDPDRLVECPSPTGDIFALKRKVRRAIEESGIPYTYVCANCLAGYFLSGLAQIGQFLPPDDKLTIYGDGNAKVVWNKEEDVAVYAAKTIDDPRVVNTTVYVRPPENVLSLNEVVEMWEQQSGRRLEKVHVPEDAWLKQMSECEDYSYKVVLGFFYIIFYLGWTCNYDVEPGQEASHLYPNYKYTNVKSYLEDYI